MFGCLRPLYGPSPAAASCASSTLQTVRSSSPELTSGRIALEPE